MGIRDGDWLRATVGAAGGVEAVRAARLARTRCFPEEIKRSPKQFVMLFRPSMRRDFTALLPNTLLFYSAYAGYLENHDWRAIEAELGEQDGQIVQAHVGGHIRQDDICRFVEAVAPRTVVPVHTFYPEWIASVHLEFEHG